MDHVRNNKISIRIMFFSLLLLLSGVIVSGFNANHHQVTEVKGCPFDSMYSFGDSSSSQVGDFLATAFHLPSANPYLNKDAEFGYGVKFAAPGATVLDASFFDKNSITLQPNNTSLKTQLEWFQTRLNSMCSSHHGGGDCKVKKLRKSLFLVGEIGSNDYKYALFQGKHIKEVTTFVPEVVRTMNESLKILIHAGAINLVVPGILPMGCLPSYLTLFHTDDSMSFTYDAHKCRYDLNILAAYHNDKLQQALAELRIEHPHVHIVYADYYKAFMAIRNNHGILGYNKSSLSKACCGSGGQYNFNLAKPCGSKGVPVCSDPTKYIHWDGIQLTESAYQNMVTGFIRGSFVHPALKLPERWHCSM